MNVTSDVDEAVDSEFTSVYDKATSSKSEFINSSAGTETADLPVTDFSLWKARLGRYATPIESISHS